jgi:hypothetical protein
MGERHVGSTLVVGLGLWLWLCACGPSSPGADAGPDAGDAGDAGADADAEVVIVPPETADDRALAALADWRALPTFGDSVYGQLASDDRGIGDFPNLPLLANGNRDANNFVCASADEQGYDGLIPVVLDQPSCPEAYVHGFVLSRFVGSGRLARLWVTAASFRTAPPTTQVLRIWVDDDPTPVIDVPMRAALDGSAGEIFAPPFGAGSTHELAWYYPVVFGSKLVVALDGLVPLDVTYHQTTVELDPTPSARTRSPTRLPARDGVIALLGSAATGPISGLAALAPAADVTLASGESRSVASLVGPATLDSLEVTVADTDVGRLGNVDVHLTWDGEATPSVSLPLAALLGAGLDATPNASLALSGRHEGTSWIFALRLPMPFAATADVTLVNHDAAALHVQVGFLGENALPATPWGHLAAVYTDTMAPATAPVQTVSLSGPGRLVGVCAMLEGHALPSGDLGSGPLNFLEGDESLFVDGHLAAHGTGTEDYFDSAFYFLDGPYATPFAQGWGVATDTAAPPHGRASACRWHVLGDAIDFTNDVQQTLEIGPGDPSLLDRYRTVAFVYR